MTRKLKIVAILVACMILLLVPTVAAQKPSLTVTAASPGVIKPDQESKQLSVTYKYTLPITAQNALGGVGIVTISFTFDCPSYVLITGPRTVTLTVSPTQSDGEYEETVPFNVATTREAPGLQSIPCTVTATGSELQGQGAPAPDSADGDFTLISDYFPLITAKVGSKVQTAGPQKQIPFEVEISNFGNAQTQVTFSLATEAPGDWDVILPEVMILDSPTRGEGQTTDTATFTVGTPFKNGWNNKQSTFNLVMKPTATLDASKEGNVQTASVLARVRGVYIPTLEPILLLGAVLGTALVARMMRE